MKQQVMKLFGIAMITFTLSFAAGMSLYTANHEKPALTQMQAQQDIPGELTAMAVLPQ